MNLWYVNIWLNPEIGYEDEYRYEFTLHTRFISNYLSKQIRKYKFATDGTFNMISVSPKPDAVSECKIVPDAALTADVIFNRERYEQIKGTPNCEYYLELLEDGFKKAKKFKEIPLDTLLNLINDFRNNDYKNEWEHKKKRFKKQDVEVTLNCFFTTLDFSLIATINKISTKETLCSRVVIRTEPDEIYFAKMFKDILIDKGNILITDASDSPRILINLKAALNKKLVFKLRGARKIKELLSYAK